MLGVPVPGGHAGDLTPDGNLGAWLDRALMSGHLWRPRWDPEGLLSTLPAVATTLIGVIAGMLRQADSPLVRDGARRWRRQLVIGGIDRRWRWVALWHPWFPINKSLWTSLYVLFTGGAAMLALALCSAWVDGEVSGWRRWSSEPFVALGRNAILLFVLSGLFARAIGVIMVDQATRLILKEWIYSTIFEPLASPRNASLLFAGTNLLLLYALLAWLHRRRCTGRCKVRHWLVTDS